MLFVQTLYGSHTPLMPERKKQASRLVAKLPASVYCRPIGFKRTIPLCHSAAYFSVRTKILFPCYTVRLCVPCRCCVINYLQWHVMPVLKKASEIVCMSFLQQERYQLRCGSLQGGENNKRRCTGKLFTCNRRWLDYRKVNRTSRC